MRSNKKAVNTMYLAAMVIAILVLFFVAYFTIKGGVFDKFKTGVIGDTGLISAGLESTCEISNGRSFEIVNCDLYNYDYQCTKEEKEKWDKYFKYLNEKDCTKTGEVGFEKEKACTCIQQKTYEIMTQNNQIKSEVNNERTKQFQESGTISLSILDKSYANNKALIEDFAKKNKIQISKLQAFIKVESGSNPFYSDKHPVVRFECLKFNQISIKKVTCNTNKYKYGNAEDTGKEAFLKALSINRDYAIQTSSFGLGQVMGEWYQLVGYDSLEKYYKAMFSEQEQYRAFLNFIQNKNGGVILRELQKENTDWAVVAYNYNGAGYKNNNYDVKLAQAETQFKQTIVSG